jgi:hypothetical protein
VQRQDALNISKCGAANHGSVFQSRSANNRGSLLHHHAETLARFGTALNISAHFCAMLKILTIDVTAPNVSTIDVAA